MSARHLPEPAPQAGGGRVELRLSGEAADVGATETGVAYECRWFWAGNEYQGAFRVRHAPKVEVESVTVPTALPEWLSAFTVTLLRTVARAAATKGYPRRLTRWRAEPGAASGSSSTED